jgi:hypothetical protein
MSAWRAALRSTPLPLPPARPLHSQVHNKCSRRTAAPRDLEALDRIFDSLELSF